MKPAALVTAIFLALVALAQFVRLVFQVEVIAGGVRIPLWASAVACVVAGGLAILLWRETLRGRRGEEGKSVASLDRGSLVWVCVIALSAILSIVTGRIFFPSQEALLEAGAIIATLVAIIWYSFETRTLRQEQERDNEIRNLPWLVGSDLKINRDTSVQKGGLIAREEVYLPIKNTGPTPAYQVRVRASWRMSGEIQNREDREVVKDVSIAPGDTWHARLCTIDFDEPSEKALIEVELTYRSFMGGSGRVRMNFFSHAKGWANGPTGPYEFTDSRGQRFPKGLGN